MIRTATRIERMRRQNDRAQTPAPVPALLLSSDAIENLRRFARAWAESVQRLQEDRQQVRLRPNMWARRG